MILFDCRDRREERKYVHWAERHEDGHVLVRISGGRLRLHKAGCGHITYAGPWKGRRARTASTTRFCFEDGADEARRYAERESGQAAVECRTCRP